MSDIQRLLRLADERGKRRDDRILKVRVNRQLLERLQARLGADGLSAAALVEAVFAGYLANHPGVLGMVDQYYREAGRLEERERPAPRLSTREHEDIYASIGSPKTEE